jgi:hypothetical protein
MLRDVVIHIDNEQPLQADLLNEPQPADVALICRNVRTMNGKKPVFIDRSDSTFVIPLVHVRFVEVSQAAMEALDAEKAAAEIAQQEAVAASSDYGVRGLARLAWLAGEAGDPSGEEEAAAPDRLEDLGSGVADPDDLDGELLRRIREV